MNPPLCLFPTPKWDKSLYRSLVASPLIPNTVDLPVMDPLKGDNVWIQVEPEE